METHGRCESTISDIFPPGNASVAGVCLQVLVQVCCQPIFLLTNTRCFFVALLKNHVPSFMGVATREQKKGGREGGARQLFSAYLYCLMRNGICQYFVQNIFQMFVASTDNMTFGKNTGAVFSSSSSTSTARLG